MAQIQTTPTQLLTSIQDQRLHNPLTTHTLLEPFQTQPNQAEQALDPSTLQADLSHFQNLFSKLRFSYIEQVTKEKYLRSIVGSPRYIGTPEENAALEQKCSEMKSELKRKKTEVGELIQEIEGLARLLAERYDYIEECVGVLQSVPVEIESMLSEIEGLEDRIGRDGVVQSDDPRMSMGLDETNEVLKAQRKRNDEVAREIELLERQIEKRTEECGRAEEELRDVEMQREEVTRGVREQIGRRTRRSVDVLETRGRWLRNEEVLLKGLLGLT